MTDKTSDKTNAARQRRYMEKIQSRAEVTTKETVRELTKDSPKDETPRSDTPSKG
jgi:hypothetical protein